MSPELPAFAPPPPSEEIPAASSPPVETARARVLHVGCGAPNREKLHPVFREAGWREVRLDIDPGVKPDIVSSITDMRGRVPNGAVDAVWSSHNIEHLHDHEVAPALAEFVRVLKGSGFALITCPDLGAVAALVAQGVERVVYESPAGPITALDMLYGHRRSIEQGNTFMCHHTGFTLERLKTALLDAGFKAALVRRGRGYNLWALALMPEAPADAVEERFRRFGMDFAKPD